MIEALADPPVVGRWDFGGFAYGLEPLVLPPAGVTTAAEERGGSTETTAGYAAICERLRALGEVGAPGSEVGPCEDRDELFWFRWITGHQVCFVVWRLIGQLFEDVDQGRRLPADIVEPVSRYVDAYSAMLLYTGSCPREVYTALIRPSMRLRHRAFSGSWAPDYWPIRDLFRGRRLSPIWSADTEELRDALALLHRVHEGVAARLVTDGGSLLREASVRGPSHRLAWLIFDNYFMTLRAPTPGDAVVTQLLRRLVAVVQDLAANGLYSPDDKDERPPELRAAEVIACEDDMIEIMAVTARYACGLRPDRAAAPHRIDSGFAAGV
jgi:L-tyrosine peroxygenase